MLADARMRRATLAAALVVTACSSASDVIDGGDASPPIPVLSESVSFADIAVYQGVKAVLVSAGARIDPPAVPIIAARPALVRTWVTLPDGWTKSLTAELHLFDVDGAPTKTLTDKKRPRVPADDSLLATSFNFQIDPAFLGPDTQFAIVVRDPAYGTRPEASIRWPKDGTNDGFGAKTDSAELKVKIVPIQYTADGSNRVPATDAASLQHFQDFLYRMYPVSTVTITVHSPFVWDQVLAPDGTGWDNLLLTVSAIRNMEKAPKDSYTVAMFNPAPTFAQFCSSGCTAGIGSLQGKMDPLARIVLMVGYQEDFVYGTLNQELAHDMGRLHAPCGSPQMIDPQFPNKDGSIGKWGWDILSRELVDPITSDFLSYCQPVFVSDYTYAALYTQMAYVTSTLPLKSVSPPRPWRVAHVSPNGGLRWGRTITWGGPVQQTKRIRLDGQIIEAPYWDLPEIHRGLIFVPEELASPASRLTW